MMNVNKPNLYQRLLVLLLIICLLSGCNPMGFPAEEPISTTESTANRDYEVYREESLAEQKAFSQLCEDLFQKNVTASALSLHFTLADPASYGITDYPITYGDLSSQKLAEDLQALKEEKAQLDNIDIHLLTDEQQLTYRILEETYNCELSSEGMELYYQPLAPAIGIQAQLPILLSEYAFYNKQDVENYLTLLSQTDEYFSDILAFEKEKSEAGLFMTDLCLDQVLDSCDGYLLPPEHNFLSETFQERLASVTDLTEEEKAAFITRNQEILSADFLSAYQLLTEGLEQLRSTGTNELGMCHYPQGKAYYEYLVRSSTGTTYETIDDLKAAIENQMNQDLVAMSNILNNNPDLADRLSEASSVEQTPEEIIDSLIQQIDQDFPELPECSYTIKYVPSALEATLSPAFYLVPPIDRYSSNTIYINPAYTDTQNLTFTLAHEGYPGHLYQTVYYSARCTEKLRQILSFSSYSEGWAFYVENYSYTFSNHMDSDLSQLLARNSSASLGLEAVLDLYINYYGWTKEQVSEYLSNYYDIDGNDIVEQIYTTLTATPTNYLEYYVGYLEILQMRETAEKTLGEDFNLKEFHTFILDMGPAPFTVIKPYFNTWLMTQSL